MTRTFYKTERVVAQLTPTGEFVNHDIEEWVEYQFVAKDEKQALKATEFVLDVYIEETTKGQLDPPTETHLSEVRSPYDVNDVVFEYDGRMVRMWAV